VRAPFFTASMAGAASSLMATHHCSDTSGSMTVLDRSLTGTFWVISSTRSWRPRAVSSSITALRAASRVIPENRPAFSLRVPSGFRMLMIGRLCRAPRS